MDQTTSDQERLRKQLQKLVQQLNIHLEDRKSQLLGQVLTITDGTTADPAQRKAVKDLVTNAFYSGSHPGEKGAVQWEVERFAHAQGLAGDLFPELTDEDLPPEPGNPYTDIK